jgi:dolichyl-phosphate beta-glucosyltransferase
MIFPNMHVERWAFDVECLYLAERQRIPMVEVPVTWHEVPPLRTLLIIGPWVKIVACKR